MYPYKVPRNTGRLSSKVLPGGGHSIVKNTGAGSIVWGLGFWLGKDILGFFKNIGLDNS